MIVVRRTGDDVNFVEGRDSWWDDVMAEADEECPAEETDAEDILYILYSSGSTGKPKGIVHTTGGYLTHVKATTKWVLDLKDDDVYWCTADIGWVTGHSYIVYGPLSNGGTSLIFEGTPSYPESDRWWQIVEDHKVNILYTAPTAIRAFMKGGTEALEKHDLSSLRLLGTVGEPINPRVGVVPRERRRRQVPHSGHLVADRDWWDHDLASPRYHPDQAGQCHLPVPRHLRDSLR